MPRLLVVALLSTAVGTLTLTSSGLAGKNGFFCGKEEATHVMDPGDGTYVGTDGRDVVVGSNDSDTIRTLDGNDLVCAEDGHDNVNGGAGQDELYGFCGNDILRGRQQEDYLDGESDFFCIKKAARRGQTEDDYCLGSKPKPDTEEKHDLANFRCEHITSAFEEGD